MATYTIAIDWQDRGPYPERIEAKTLAEAGTAARAISLIDGVAEVSVLDTDTARLRNTYEQGQVIYGPDSAAMLSRTAIFAAVSK